MKWHFSTAWKGRILLKFEWDGIVLTWSELLGIETFPCLPLSGIGGRKTSWTQRVWLRLKLHWKLKLKFNSGNCCQLYSVCKRSKKKYWSKCTPVFRRDSQPCYRRCRLKNVNLSLLRGRGITSILYDVSSMRLSVNLFDLFTSDFQLSGVYKCAALWRKSMKRMHMTSWQPYWCSKAMNGRSCCWTKPVLWEFKSFLM